MIPGLDPKAMKLINKWRWITIISPAILYLLIFISLLGIVITMIRSFSQDACGGWQGFITGVISVGEEDAAYREFCRIGESLSGGAGSSGGCWDAEYNMSDFEGPKSWTCGGNAPTRAEKGSEKKEVVYYYDGGSFKLSGGTAAWRNNNPGNIRKSSNQIGNIGGFAVFATYDDGYNDIFRLLNTSTYVNKSIKDAIFTYAPPVENDSEVYANRIKKMTGLDISRKINSLNEDELTKVVDAITIVEGSRAGKISGSCEIKYKESTGTKVALAAETTSQKYYFPVEEGSLADRGISDNFGDRRESGGRCHSGVDIYTKNPARIISIADGTVVEIIDGFYSDSIGDDYLLIQHEIDGREVSIGYGEITGVPGEVRKVGAQVKAGQFLGFANVTRMVHMELYDGFIKSRPGAWNPEETVKQEKHYCANNESINKIKPKLLADAYPLLSSLKSGSSPDLGDGYSSSGDCIGEISNLDGPTINASGKIKSYADNDILKEASSGATLRFDTAFGENLIAAIQDAKRNGISIIIASGFRSGSGKSNHNSGRAVDINARDKDGNLICAANQPNLCSASELKADGRSSLSYGCSDEVRAIFARHGIYGKLCYRFGDFPCGDCNHFSLSGR